MPDFRRTQVQGMDSLRPLGTYDFPGRRPFTQHALCLLLLKFKLLYPCLSLPGRKRRFGHRCTWALHNQPHRLILLEIRGSW